MDFFNILTDSFDWCTAGNGGLKSVFGLIKLCLNIIRFVVPMGLIFMTVLDVSKNVINPEEKSSMKKIGNRVIAAIIVFLIPTIVNLVIGLVDIALPNRGNDGGSLKSCWDSAKGGF